MAEIRYLISDASKKVDVESHVLRYWEEELELSIPRNDMGHRYYTGLHIRLFQKIKELKEKGYQLKAIKNVMSRMMESNGELEVTDELLEESATAALKESAAGLDAKETKENVALTPSEAEAAPAVFVATEEKMIQFQQIMNHIIGEALQVNNEKLSQDISALVHDKVSKEMEYLVRIGDEKDDERFRHLDEMIRTYQKEGKSRAEAAATKTPFFKRKKQEKKARKFF